MTDFDEEALLAEIMSQVSHKPSIYKKIGGHDTFVKISECFYEKLFTTAHNVPSFKVMFIDRARLAQDQYEYLIQRFGGPDLYSQRQGWPAMKLRHAQFEIKPADADLWMSLMKQALDEVLGDNFPEEKAEMIRALDEQAQDLVTTLEDGTRVYGPLDRVTYAQQLKELKDGYH